MNNFDVFDSDSRLSVTREFLESAMGVTRVSFRTYQLPAMGNWRIVERVRDGRADYRMAYISGHHASDTYARARLNNS